MDKMMTSSFNSGILSRGFAVLGDLTLFTLRFFRYAVVPPYEFAQIKKHIDELGAESFPLVSITGILMGFILAMQGHPILGRFGSELLIPAMVAISVVRELGPVITALIVAGRVSSGIGAELGSMRVTEQIDALEVSAVDPFNYLVVTRITACIIIVPLLTVYADFLSLIGAYISMWIELGTSWRLYVDLVVRSLSFSDLIPGISKTFFFGFIIGLVGCYRGYTAAGGTEGVGRAATNAVVLASLLIIFVDMVLVKVSILIWGY